METGPVPPAPLPHPAKQASDKIIKVTKLDPGQESAPLLGGELRYGGPGICRISNDDEVAVASHAYAGASVASPRGSPAKPF